MESDARKNLQLVINHIFTDFRSSEAFREFNEESNTKLREVLLRLDSKFIKARAANADTSKSLKSAALLVIDLISKEGFHPSLVKLALGIFLTHNKEAQKLGIIPPPIKLHSEFASLQKTPITNPVTPDRMKGYEALAYFREDYDFNDHHYHWHMVYPYSGHVEGGKFKRTIDRQGELFLYMHSQMIARYNTELMSWGLDITHAWGYDDVLTFGYDPVPNIRDLYGARPAYQGWFEDHNPKIPDSEASGFPSKESMIRCRDNIFNSITSGQFDTVTIDPETKLQNGYGKLELASDNAMNWVGVVVEAEDPPLQEVNPGEFIDRSKYGNVHNLGHDKFAEIGYHTFTSEKNPLGVMISNIGSPRDPCFWLWHRHIDDFRQAIVKKYIHKLDEFQPKGLKIVDLKILSRTSSKRNLVTLDNQLYTFLGTPQLEKNEVNAKIDHEPYKWELTITRTSDIHDSSFIVRIFIAPTVLIQDQRSWIEMDKFNATIDSASQTYTRKDIESSVARKEGDNLDPRCRCGWPQNMMLPIGTPEGMNFVAFAMLTTGQLSASGATQSISFCGAADGLYPDQLGMGYPFDKTWYSRVNSTAPIRDIVENMPHIKLYDFTIKRYTKMYEGNLDHLPPSTITWENKIKNFFTEEDTKCMKDHTQKSHPDHVLDLSNKESVIYWASDIYYETFLTDMPLDDEEKIIWKKEGRVEDFKQWMVHGFQ